MDCLAEDKGLVQLREGYDRYRAAPEPENGLVSALASRFITYGAWRSRGARCRRSLWP